MALAVLVVTVGIAAGCGADHDQSARPTQLFAPGITDVTAMVVLPDTTVRVALRASGTVEDVSATSGNVKQIVAHVNVHADGQRGLLGLAVDPSGRTFASWTRPDGRLVVGQIDPAAPRLVWEGPDSADLANGGHLDWRAGRLVIGIGDLTVNERKDDPAAINGKLVSLDPDGERGQTPTIISSGWNNPFAFTVLDDQSIWIADNSPSDRGERLARGDTAPIDPIELPAGTAPAAIDHIGTDQLVICGYVSGALLRYELRDGRPHALRTLATDCRTAVVVDGSRVIYAADDGLRVLSP